MICSCGRRPSRFASLLDAPVSTVDACDKSPTVEAPAPPPFRGVAAASNPPNSTAMIEHTLDTTSAILHVRPKSSLQEADFETLAANVDPFIAASGDLAGLIIETPSFPGWESLGAMIAHFRFVRDHHKHVRKVALVTDSALGTIAEKIGSHFVSAEVMHFPASSLDAAKAWILSPS